MKFYTFLLLVIATFSFAEFFPTKPKAPPQYLSPYVIGAPEIMRFYEDQETVYEFNVTVPPPGTPLLIVKESGKQGLPVGMTVTLTGNKATLKWKPDYGQGKDPKDPSSKFREFYLDIMLGKLEEKNTFVQKKPLVIVYDKPQKFEISFFEKNQIKETVVLKKTDTILRVNVKVESKDFPKGPFILSCSSSLPDGFFIIQNVNEPNLFVFQADSKAVDYLRSKKQYDIEFKAITIRGYETSAKLRVVAE